LPIFSTASTLMRHRSRGKGWCHCRRARGWLGILGIGERRRIPSPLPGFVWLPADTSEPWDRERLRQIAVAAATFLSRWRWYILDGANLQRDKVRRESNMTRSSLAIASIALTAAFALPAREQDVLPGQSNPSKDTSVARSSSPPRISHRRSRRPRMPRISCSS